MCLWSVDPPRTHTWHTQPQHPYIGKVTNPHRAQESAVPHHISNAPRLVCSYVCVYSDIHLMNRQRCIPRDTQRWMCLCAPPEDTIPRQSTAPIEGTPPTPLATQCFCLHTHVAMAGRASHSIGPPHGRHIHKRTDCATSQTLHRPSASLVVAR